MTQPSLFPEYETTPTAPAPQRPTTRSVIDGYVYIIHGYDDIYKIGRSIDTIGRRRSMVKMPFTMTMIHRIKCDDCVEAESIIHNYHARHRVNGEWFHLGPDDLAALCSVDYLPVFGLVRDPKNAEVLRAYCKALPFDYARALAFVLPEQVKESGLRETPVGYVA
jgi:hypothetical protein